MEALSKIQKEFGENKIQIAMRRWGVSKEQAIKILLDVIWIDDQWKWVNIEQFLMEKLNGCK